MTLATANTFTGNTLISGGMLKGSGSLTKVGNGVLLLSGSGTGSLSSVTINPSGQIAPGSPLGTLALSGSLVLATGAVFDYDLDKPVTSDTITCGQVVVAIPLRFSNFSFAYTSKFGPGVYDLIQSDTVLPASILGGSTSGSVDGLPATLAVQGNNLVLNVVPEPGALAMLGAGVLGLLGWCRQRAARIEP